MSDFDLYESEIEELYREPEEPKIWLTLEEANTIRNILNHYWIWQRLRGRFDKSDECWELYKKLNNSIKQAEGKCESV